MAGERDVTPEQAEALRREQDAQLIDVREDHEWDAGRIGGARHIVLGEVASQASTIERDRPVVFYCRVGDLVQPRLEAGAALEAVEPAPRAQERLLHDVLGVVRRAEHPVAVDLERAAVRLHERAERPLVAGLGGGDEQRLVGLAGERSGHHLHRPPARPDLIGESCAFSAV
jgi:hypothetical protein